jgi:arylsulfatase A-like enzyme
MLYRVFNHNGTLLGEFTTLAQAVREQNYYTAETGNDAYIDIKKSIEKNN